MNCGAEGCTEVHSRGRPYREQCPRTRVAHTSRESHVKYSTSIKGVLRNVRYRLKTKEADVGEVD